MAKTPTATAASRPQPLRRDFGELHAVDGVDLEVPDGQIFGFLGPNGAGKSTLVKMLTTILTPTAGSAPVAGYDVAREGGRVRQIDRRGAAGCGSRPHHDRPRAAGPAGAAVRQRAGGGAARADRLLKTVGLDDVDPKKRARAYSGGMKRRLDLALALVHDPSILFLDEPTTGLDPASRAAIWEEVRRLNEEQGMTIFLTTQYLEEADRLADRIAIINKGRIAAEGTPEELKRQVGDEVVELRLRRRRRGGARRRGAEGVAPSRQAAGHELRLYFPRAAESVPELIRTLDAAGLQPVRPARQAAEPRRRVPAHHRRGARRRGARRPAGARRGRRRAAPAERPREEARA